MCHRYTNVCHRYTNVSGVFILQDQALFSANKSGIYVVEFAYHSKSLSNRDGLTSVEDAGSQNQDTEQEVSKGTSVVNKDQTIKG